jgi:hypothetical protein
LTNRREREEKMRKNAIERMQGIIRKILGGGTKMKREGWE